MSPPNEPTRARSLILPSVATGVLAGQRGGGCEIRTREGLPPTRFPSVRPRPLGESSAGKLTGPAETRGSGADLSVRVDRLAADPSHGVISPTPPGPEGSKGTRALSGVRGVPSRPGEDADHGRRRARHRAREPRPLRRPIASCPAGAVPQIPARHLCRGQGPGTRDGAA